MIVQTPDTHSNFPASHPIHLIRAIEAAEQAGDHAEAERLQTAMGTLYTD
jgi:hypothetical protein